MREHAGRLTPRQVLVLLFICTLLYGALFGYGATHHAHGPGFGPSVEILFSFLSFYWYRLDSDIRHYRRSKPLNIGIILFATVALPYYLVRSRPPGQRARALWRLAEFSMLLLAGVFAGAALTFFLG